MMRLLLASLLTLPLTVSLPAAEKVPPCFPGAIYRKAVSSKADWTGIEATVTLPRLEVDPTRTNPKNGRPLDNSSIYLGGSSGEQEIDAGLSWEVIRDAAGSVTPQRVAYRPFWRNDQWFNAPAKADLYFFPGDTVTMYCRMVEDEQMELGVRLVKRAPESLERLAELKLRTSDYPTTFTARFEATDFRMSGPQEFKRVNAIDQSGNEGKEVQATSARQIDLVWREVYLLRGEERIPFTPDLYHDMRCPDPKQVEVSPAPGIKSPSAERVNLRGSKAMNP